jgi:retron-type reverse transcriptase
MEITSGETVRSPVSVEVNRPRDESDNVGQGLMERAFARENLKRAWKRVKANKGGAGVDGLDIEQTAEHLLTQWAAIREQLMSGIYRPSPVCRWSSPSLMAVSVSWVFQRSPTA